MGLGPSDAAGEKIFYEDVGTCDAASMQPQCTGVERVGNLDERLFLHLNSVVFMAGFVIGAWMMYKWFKRSASITEREHYGLAL